MAGLFDDLLPGAAPAGSGLFDDLVPAAKPKAPLPERSKLAAINDTVIDAANAVAGGVGSVADFVSPGNPVSSFIDENIIKPGQEKQSDRKKAINAQLSEEIANADGLTGEAAAAVRYALADPAGVLAQAAGSFVVPGGAIKGAGMLARFGGAGAKGVSRAGLAGGVAAGAALSGGDAAGQAYEESKAAGATEEQAQAAARQASVIPAIVGGAGGMLGAERLLAGGRGFKGGAVSRAVKTGLSEGVQEGLEEGVTQYEANRAVAPFDGRDPMKGVGAAATLGAVMGAPIGGVTGALSREVAPALAPAPAPAVDPVLPILSAGSVDDAIKAATEATSGKPAGGGLDRLRGILPDEQRREVIGLMATANNPNSPPNVRRFAEQQIDAILREYTDIPTADVVEETDLLPTADATELTDEQRAAYVNTPGFVDRYRMSRGIPVGEATEAIPTGDAAEVEPIPAGEVVEDIPAPEAFEQLPVGETADLIPTGEATEAPAKIPTGKATEIVPEVIDGDLLTKDQQPYGSRIAAAVRAKKEGGAVVPVQGGWVVRLQNGADVQSSALKGLADGRSTDPKQKRDISDGESSANQRLSNLDVPRQRVVLSDVIRRLEDDQVVRRVVQLVPVDVVDMLFGEQGPSNDPLRNRAVLKNALSAFEQNPVASNVNVAADAIMRAVASVTAELGSTGASTNTIPDKRGAAMDARKGLVGGKELPAAGSGAKEAAGLGVGDVPVGLEDRGVAPRTLNGRQVNSPTRIDELGSASGATNAGPPTVSPKAPNGPNPARTAGPRPADGARGDGTGVLPVQQPADVADGAAPPSGEGVAGGGAAGPGAGGRDEALTPPAQQNLQDRLNDARRIGKEAAERGEPRDPPQAFTGMEKQVWRAGWDQGRKIGGPTPQVPALDAAEKPRKTMQEGRTDAALDRQVRENGEITTRRQWVERKVAEGLKTRITQEDRIKPMSRMQFFRANNEEQRAHERKIKEAGKKDVYWIGDYEVTKIEHDYANQLAAAPAPAPTPEPAAAPAPTLADKIKQRRAEKAGPATAQRAIDAFNADDDKTAMEVVARLPLADLQEVGAAIGFRPQINENAKRYRKRLAEVAPRLTKTAREKSARQRALFDKLMDRASDYDRAADHAARAKANGVADDSTAYLGFYRPMGTAFNGESQEMRIPELLDRLAADVASLRDDPDYAEVAPMVRDKRPRVFEHKAQAAPLNAPAPAEGGALRSVAPDTKPPGAGAPITPTAQAVKEKLAARKGEWRPSAAEVLKAVSDATPYGKPYTSTEGQRQKARILKALEGLGLKPREAQSVLDKAMTTEAQRRMPTMRFILNSDVRDAADALGYIRSADAPAKRDEYPLGKTDRDDRFFGTRVRVLPELKGDTAWEGVIQSTLNGGRLFTVKRGDSDARPRITGDRLEILEIKDADTKPKEPTKAPASINLLPLAEKWDALVAHVKQDGGDPDKGQRSYRALTQFIGRIEEKPLEIWDRWSSVFGSTGLVDMTGPQVLKWMESSLPTVLDGYIGSLPGNTLSVNAGDTRYWQNAAAEMERRAPDHNRYVDRLERQALDVEMLGGDADKVATARKVIYGVKQAFGRNQRTVQQGLAMAERREQEQAEQRETAEAAKYKPFDAKELSKKPTPASMSGWFTANYEGKTVWTQGTILDLSGEPPHLAGYESRRDTLGRNKDGKLDVSRVIPRERGPEAVPFGFYDGEFGKTAKNGIVYFDAEGRLVGADATLFRYFASKFKGATYFASPAGDVITVRHGGKTVGVLMPIKLGTDAQPAPTLAEMRAKVSAKPAAAPAAQPEAEAAPDALTLTPKQYHDARLRQMAVDTGTPLAEVREMYDTEGGRAESNRLWGEAVNQAAQAGEALSRQTIDKLLELNPTARLPETAIPEGYQRPEARKQETEAKDAIRQDRREAKAEREAAPARDEKTIELRKRLSVLRSLKDCIA